MVICKNWRWAALAYAAARVAGLASKNFLDSFSHELVIPFHDEASDSTASELSPDGAFLELCESIWRRINASCNEWLFDMEKQQRSKRDALSMQSEEIGRQLESLKSVHATAVQTLLDDSE